jgi:hypothetical protein
MGHEPTEVLQPMTTTHAGVRPLISPAELPSLNIMIIGSCGLKVSVQNCLRRSTTSFTYSHHIHQNDTYCTLCPINGRHRPAYSRVHVLYQAMANDLLPIQGMTFTRKNCSTTRKGRLILFRAPSKTSLTKEISSVADVMNWYILLI